VLNGNRVEGENKQFMSADDSCEQLHDGQFYLESLIRALETGEKAVAEVLGIPDDVYGEEVFVVGYL